MINRRRDELPGLVLIPVVKDYWAEIAWICH
jgi:hypothetical protein